MKQEQVLAEIDKLRKDIEKAIQDSEQRILDRINVEGIELRHEQPKKPYSPDSALGQLMGNPQPSPFGKEK